MKTLDDIIATLGPYAEQGTAPTLPNDIVAIVMLARELKQLKEEANMRQEPKVLKVGSVTTRMWRAWGICTQDGTLAELTMDPQKAAVWTAGGHKVIEFSHEESDATSPKAAGDGEQGRLL